jgi:hypothetical protein
MERLAPPPTPAAFRGVDPPAVVNLTAGVPTPGAEPFLTASDPDDA